MKTCFLTGDLLVKLHQNMLTGRTINALYCQLWYLFNINLWIESISFKDGELPWRRLCHEGQIYLLEITDHLFFHFSKECITSILQLAQENHLTVIPLVQSIGHFEVWILYFEYLLSYCIHFIYVLAICPLLFMS